MDIMNLIRTYRDRIGAIGCTAVGALLLVLGWNGVSKEIYPAGQIPYVISDGFGGLFLLGVGAILWLSADLRDEWSKLDALDQRLETLADLAGGSVGEASYDQPSKAVPARPARRAEAPAVASSTQEGMA